MKKLFQTLFALLLTVLLSNTALAACCDDESCGTSCSTNSCSRGCSAYGLWGSGFGNDLSFDVAEVDDGVDHLMFGYKSASKGFSMGIERDLKCVTVGVGYLYADTVIDSTFTDFNDPSRNETLRSYEGRSNMLFVTAEKEFRRWKLSGFVGYDWDYFNMFDFLGPSGIARMGSFVLNGEAKVHAIDKSRFRLSPLVAMTLINTDIDFDYIGLPKLQYQDSVTVCDAAVEMRYLAHRNFLLYSRTGYRYFTGAQDIDVAFAKIFGNVSIYQPQNIFRFDVGMEWQITQRLALEGGYLLRAGEYNYESHSFYASLVWKRPSQINNLLRGQRSGSSRFGRSKTNWSDRVTDTFSNLGTNLLNIINTGLAAPI